MRSEQLKNILLNEYIEKKYNDLQLKDADYKEFCDIFIGEAEQQEIDIQNDENFYRLQDEFAEEAIDNRNEILAQDEFETLWQSVVDNVSTVREFFRDIENDKRIYVAFVNKARGKFSIEAGSVNSWHIEQNYSTTRQSIKRLCRNAYYEIENGNNVL